MSSVQVGQPKTECLCCFVLTLAQNMSKDKKCNRNKSLDFFCNMKVFQVCSECVCRFIFAATLLPPSGDYMYLLTPYTFSNKSSKDKCVMF